MMIAQDMPPPVAVLPALAAPSAVDEVNHRVANQLQLLAALISIEARQMNDPGAVAVLERTRLRIAAIGSVHRQLYLGGGEDVDLGAYLDDLGEHLAQSCPAHRPIIVDVDSVPATGSAATSIGILATELVTNACKHAYAADESGSILISLRRRPDGSQLFLVEDRGHGCRSGSGSAGLGSRLIDATVAKLGGSAIIEDARPGTRFRMIFAQ